MPVSKKMHLKHSIQWNAGTACVSERTWGGANITSLFQMLRTLFQSVKRPFPWTRSWRGNGPKSHQRFSGIFRGFQRFREEDCLLEMGSRKCWEVLGSSQHSLPVSPLPHLPLCYLKNCHPARGPPYDEPLAFRVRTSWITSTLKCPERQKLSN